MLPPGATSGNTLSIEQGGQVAAAGQQGQVGAAAQAPSFNEKQVRQLQQAGISFFNNAWSKVTALPAGGYSVVPVDA